MNYAFLIEVLQQALARLTPNQDPEQTLLTILGLDDFGNGEVVLKANGVTKSYFLELLEFNDPLIRRDLGLTPYQPLSHEQTQSYLVEEIRYLQASQSYAQCEALYGLAPLSALNAVSRTHG